MPGLSIRANGSSLPLVLIERIAHVRGGCTPGNSRPGQLAVARAHQENSARARRGLAERSERKSFWGAFFQKGATLPLLGVSPKRKKLGQRPHAPVRAIERCPAGSAQRKRPPPIHSPRNPWKRTEKAPSPQRRPREKRQGGNPRIAPFPRGFLREARARRWRSLPGLYLPPQVWYNSRRKWGRGRREKTSRPARRREAACATCSPQVWYNQRNLRERRRLRAHFGY